MSERARLKDKGKREGERGCCIIVTTYYSYLLYSGGPGEGGGGFSNSDPLTGRAIVSGVCLLAVFDMHAHRRTGRYMFSRGGLSYGNGCGAVRCGANGMWVGRGGKKGEG